MWIKLNFLNILMILTVLSLPAKPFELINTPCFSAKYEKPQELFLEAYQSSKVIGWGVTTHHDMRPIRLLSEFLDVIGKDEKLVYIFVELPAFSQEIFKKISLHGNAADMDANRQLGDYYGYYLYPKKLDQSQERQMFLHVYKKVFELNESRKRKLMIVPIDSAKGEFGTMVYPSLSYDREFYTAKNFQYFYDQMKSDEKAIALYHSYHLSRNIKGKTYNHENAQWVKNPVSFMGLANIDDKDFSNIVFDSPKQTNNGPWHRLFRRPEFIHETDSFLALKPSEFASKNHLLNNHPETVNSPPPPLLALRLSELTLKKQCLNDYNYYNYYVKDPQFPTPISRAFQYLIWLN